jgi:hypothetical protein
MTAPAQRAHQRAYKPTEAKYKGGAEEMYVTYDLAQETRAGRSTVYPKVKRVYIAGQVKDWRLGTFPNRAGRKVHGVKIEYEQRRAGYDRKPYRARRAGAAYKVSPAHVTRGELSFAKVVEVPAGARNVRFYKGQLPAKYRSALQTVR